MEQLALNLIREAHASPRPSETVVRAVANATNTLCQWAADPTVPDAVAAPCITEAVSKVADITRRAGLVRTPPISSATLRVLKEALETLQSFLSDEDDDSEEEDEENDDGEERGRRESAYGGFMRRANNQTRDDPLAMNNQSTLSAAANSTNVLLSPSDQKALGNAGHHHHQRREKKRRSEVREKASALRRAMPADEVVKASMRGWCYMRALTCSLWVVLVIFVVLLAAVGIAAFREADDARQTEHVAELLEVAVQALDALHPALLEEDLDIRHTGLSYAAEMLAELSATRAIGKYATDQMMFFNPYNRLYEFRAGVQAFDTSDNRVTAVGTPRHYSSLCRRNQSYPLSPLNDAGWRVASFVFPQLTPNLCENDAGAQGVFSGILPPYVHSAPHVKTYRRNAARVASYHHAGFGISVAVTEDWAPIQNLLVPSSTLFGAQSIFASVIDPEGWWKRSLYVRLGVLLVIALGAFMLVAQMFTLAPLQFRGHRLVLALAQSAVAAVILVVALLSTREAIHSASTRALEERTQSVARCLASGLTSRILAAHGDAKVTFLGNAMSKGVLKGRFFFMRGGTTVASPPEMQPVADAINAAEFVYYGRAQVTGTRGGYVFSDFAQPGESRHLVLADAASKADISAPELTAVVVCGCVAVLLVALGFLYATPMRRLPLTFAAGSAILTHKLSPSRLRQIYYSVLAVVTLAAVVSMNCYGVALVKEAMTEQAKETLEVIGATTRVASVVDTCDASCGFPSYLVGMDFKRTVNNSALYVITPNPLPFSNVVGWEDRYLGAQLVMGQLPVVLEQAPSFSTAIVNETTGVVQARGIVRNMMMSVDINSSYGFTVERLGSPAGEAGSHYAFVSHSMGVCVVGCAVAIFFAILERAYTQLLFTDSRNEKPAAWAAFTSVRGGMLRCLGGRKAAYVVFVLVSTLCMAGVVVLNAGLLRAHIRNGFVLFANSEMSCAQAALIERLESAALGDPICLPTGEETCSDARAGGQRAFQAFLAHHHPDPALRADTATPSSKGDGRDNLSSSNSGHKGRAWYDGLDEDTIRMTWNLAAAVAAMQDGVGSSIAPYVRLVLLQEYPRFGSNRVRIITGPEDMEKDGDPSYNPPTYDFGRLDFGTIPQCRTVGGAILTPNLPKTKRYCYVEIPGGSTTSDTLPPRNFFMLVREDADIVSEVSESIWRTLMLTSTAVAVAVLLLYVVFTWFFLAASHHHAFAVFRGDQMLTVQGPIPRFFQSIDMYIPRRYRARWLVTTLLGMLAALTYYASTSQVFIEGLKAIHTMGIPSQTQEANLLGTTNGILMDGYNYVLVAQTKSLAAMQDSEKAIDSGNTDYEFLSSDIRAEVAGVAQDLRNQLAGSTDLGASLTSDLVPGGWDTYQSNLAGEYEPYVLAQNSILSLCHGLYESVDMFFTSNHAEDQDYVVSSDPDYRTSFITLITTIAELRDRFRQFFILEHAAVASYLVFRSTTFSEGDENAFWPFANTNGGAGGTDADASAQRVLAIATHMMKEIAVTAAQVGALSQIAYADSQSLLSVTTETLSTILTTLPAASALYSAVLRSGLGDLGSIFSSSVISTGSTTPLELWTAQRLRAREVNFMSNFTSQAQAEAATTAALDALSTAAVQFDGPVGNEIRVRKVMQLGENLARHVPLTTLRNRLRWECFQAVGRLRSAFLVSFICTCVFYGVWVIGTALWLAATRERVMWWLATSTSLGVALMPRAASGSGNAAEKAPLMGKANDVRVENADEEAMEGTYGRSNPLGGWGRKDVAGHSQGADDGGTVTPCTDGDGDEDEPNGGAPARRARWQRQREAREVAQRRAALEEEQGFWYRVLGRYSRRYTLAVLLVLGGLALVPVGIAFWLNNKGVADNLDTDGAAAMGLRTVMYQLDLEGSCRSLVYDSAKSYATNDLASLTHLTDSMSDQALRLAHTYMWRLRDEATATRSNKFVSRADGDARLSSEVVNFLKIAASVREAVIHEVRLFQSQIPTSKLRDFSIGLSDYARAIVDGLAVVESDEVAGFGGSRGAQTPDSTVRTAELLQTNAESEGRSTTYTYDGVMPLSLSHGLSAVHQYAVALDGKSADAARAATDFTSLSAVVQAYRGLLESLEQVTEAQLTLWQVIVLAARNSGGLYARKHGAATLDSLVGAAARAKMSDGTPEGDAAVTEIAAYFADALATLGGGNDPDAVERLFQETSFESMPAAGSADAQCLNGALTAAAICSSYLSAIVTEADFRHIFAFNRGIVPLSQRSVEEQLDGDESRRVSPYTSTSGSASPLAASEDASAPEPSPLVDKLYFYQTRTPLLELMGELIAYSKQLMQEGVDGIDHYAERAATTNRWIWKTEVYGVPEEGDVYSVSRVDLYVTWCVICALWIAGFALIYMTYALDLLS